MIWPKQWQHTSPAGAGIKQWKISLNYRNEDELQEWLQTQDSTYRLLTFGLHPPLFLHSDWFSWIDVLRPALTWAPSYSTSGHTEFVLSVYAGKHFAYWSCFVICFFYLDVALFKDCIWNAVVSDWKIWMCIRCFLLYFNVTFSWNCHFYLICFLLHET